MTLYTIDITRFEAGNERGVIDLILPIQREEFGFALTAEDQPDLSAIPEFYQSGNGDFWVALADGAVVGTIGLKDRNKAAIHEFAVHAHGAGTALTLTAAFFCSSEVEVFT